MYMRKDTLAMKNEPPRNPERLTDAELLEFLLHAANPRRDSLRMSQDLVECYGSFAGVIEAGDDAILVRGVDFNDVQLFRKFREIIRAKNPKNISKIP
jgi:DNA repair protein RadC